ncbi:APC family permease [Acidiferrobacter sp.]|uniref:APC family permease n=1 Tax=Acidiferrobacter sp. TaxID=1872107 RepID=UPI002619AE02|nr:APC family permease [Acidiferrobacter sp.]
MPEGLPPRLVADRVSFIETLGHALANITPSAMATVTISFVVAQSGLMTWEVYLAVGLIMLLVAAQVATLAHEVPAAGSLFVSVSRSLHPAAGVLSGWAMTGGYLGALLAAPLVGGLFAGKALRIIGLDLPWPWVALAFAGISWALTVHDVEEATRYSLYVEAVSLLIILAIGVWTLMHSPGTMPILPPARFRAAPFFQGMTLSILAYGGFETAANFGREAHAPGRDIPRAIFAAVLVSLGFYVFMAIAEVAGFGGRVHELASTPAPLSVLALRQGLPLLAFASDIAMAIAAFSATIATQNSLGRVLYSMGRHKVLPAALGEIGPHGTPAVALHGLGAMACGFAIWAGWAKWPPLVIINLFGVFTALGFILIYLLALLAVPVLYRRRGQRPPWPSWAAPVLAGPILVYVFGEDYWGAKGVALIAAYGFLVYLALGAGLYGLWRHRAGTQAGVLVFGGDDD